MSNDPQATAKATHVDYSCSSYKPMPGSRRCIHYVNPGKCRRKAGYQCIEWLKLNPQKALPNIPRDLFGEPLPKPKPKKRTSPPVATTKAKKDDPILVRDITDDEIAAFKQAGLGVKITNDELGDIWIVGEYSDSGRKEIAVDHAATIAAVCSAFPGAQVTAFEMIPKPTEEDDMT